MYICIQFSVPVGLSCTSFGFRTPQLNTFGEICDFLSNKIVQSNSTARLNGEVKAWKHAVLVMTPWTTLFICMTTWVCDDVWEEWFYRASLRVFRTTLGLLRRRLYVKSRGYAPGGCGWCDWCSTFYGWGVLLTWPSQYWRPTWAIRLTNCSKWLVWWKRQCVREKVERVARTRYTDLAIRKG